MMKLNMNGQEFHIFTLHFMYTNMQQESLRQLPSPTWCLEAEKQSAAAIWNFSLPDAQTTRWTPLRRQEWICRARNRWTER